MNQIQFDLIISDDTSLCYTSLRQSVGASTIDQSQTNSSSIGDVSRRILRSLSKPSMQKKHRKQPRTDEREWLLLGEPASQRNTIILDDDEQDTSTLTITPPAPLTGPGNVTPPNAQTHSEDSSTDTDTDIDAAVDEYKQRVEVESGSSEKVLRVPSQQSWELSKIILGFYTIGIFLCMIGVHSTVHSIILFGAGFVGE